MIRYVKKQYGETFLSWRDRGTACDHVMSHGLLLPWHILPTPAMSRLEATVLVTVAPPQHSLWALRNPELGGVRGGMKLAPVHLYRAMGKHLTWAETGKLESCQ